MFTAMQARLGETAKEMLQETGDKLVQIVPQALLAVSVLAAGVISAFIAWKIVLHLCDFLGIDKLAAKVNVDRALRAVGIRRSVSRILGLLIYWLIILFALLLMSEALDLSTVSDAIGAIVAYIPRLIAGLLILLVGLLVGRFLRDIVSTSLARGGVAAGAALGFTVQAVIVIFACLLALRQVGFDVSIITTNLSVILGVLLVSAGFAVALAVRPVLENYFLCRQLQRHLRRGDHVAFADVEGEVVDFSLTSVVIRSGDADIIVPARQLFEQRFSKKIKNQ